ncbi:hypothetical protein J6TS2_22080 [Heyndrickxia sporothermodurans]|nr:hypothetical protein J6TS2_22080 [Heyndrickxia sporothermodurans]
MKKFLIFISSFFLLYMILQIGSGFILTMMYTPNTSIVDSQLSQEVVFGKSSSFSLVIPLLAAILSFFIARQVRLPTKKHK